MRRRDASNARADHPSFTPPRSRESRQETLHSSSRFNARASCTRSFITSFRQQS
jgi:hypothetical protein